MGSLHRGFVRLHRGQMSLAVRGVMKLILHRVVLMDPREIVVVRGRRRLDRAPTARQEQRETDEDACEQEEHGRRNQQKAHKRFGGSMLYREAVCA